MCKYLDNASSLKYMTLWTYFKVIQKINGKLVNNKKVQNPMCTRVKRAPVGLLSLLSLQVTDLACSKEHGGPNTFKEMFLTFKKNNPKKHDEVCRDAQLCEEHFVYMYVSEGIVVPRHHTS